jgi:hypothetical protein
MRKALMVIAAVFMAAVSFVGLPAAALAQGSVGQVGAIVPGDPAIWAQNGYVMDGGPASGTGQGNGIGQFLMQSRGGSVAPSSANGFGLGPFQANGSGQFNSHDCRYAGTPQSPAGSYFLCFDPDTTVGSFSGGLLSYGSIGVAPQLPLAFDVNGVLYQFPFSGAGSGNVIGSGPTTVGGAACFGNTLGTLIGACANPFGNVIASGSVSSGQCAVFTGTGYNVLGGTCGSGGGGNVTGSGPTTVGQPSCFGNVLGTSISACGSGIIGNVFASGASISGDCLVSNGSGPPAYNVVFGACGSGGGGNVTASGTAVSGNCLVSDGSGPPAYNVTFGTCGSGATGGPWQVETTNGVSVAAFTSFLNLPQNPSFATSPTGNPTGGTLLSTISTLNVQGTTANASNREFLVGFGLTSTLGNGVANNNGDKVTLYLGAVGNSGTGDLWAFNPLLTQSAGSGTYNAQVNETDLNNFNADRGGTDGPSGYPSHVAVGMSVSGASDFHGYTNTAGIAIDSFGGPSVNVPLWAHGISFNGFYKWNAIADYAQAPTFLALFGGHSYGIDCSQASITSGCLKLQNGINGGIIGQESSFPANAKLLRYDGTNIYFAETGVGGVFIAAPLTPSSANTYAIGGPSTRFATMYANAFDASVNMFVNGTQVATASGIAGQCAQFTSAQMIVATGSACGSGGGGSVTSVSAGTNMTVSPTTGAVVVNLSATPNGLTSLGVGTSTVTSTITDNGTLGVSGAASFSSAVDLAGSVEMNGLISGTPANGLCLTSAFQVVACAVPGGGVTSVTSGNGDISVSPTTGAVVITLNPTPILTALTVGTVTNIATITDNGTMAVSGAAAFNSSSSFAGSVQMTGLTGGTPTKYACFDSTGLLVASTSAC